MQNVVKKTNPSLKYNWWIKISLYYYTLRSYYFRLSDYHKKDLWKCKKMFSTSTVSAHDKYYKT